MQPEAITIKSNFDLEARVWKPENSRKGIVVAHSFRNNMDEPAIAEAADSFAQEGYNVLSFNFLGHGNSGGRLRDVSYSAAAQNVASSIDFLRESGCERVGVYALSLATIASVLSPVKPNAQVLLNPSPVYNPKGLLERYASSIDRNHLAQHGYTPVVSGSGRGSFEMGKAWIDEMENENGEIFRKHQARAVPTLIIQGTCDQLTSEREAKDFARRSGDTYTEITEGDHTFTEKSHRDQVIHLASRWFEHNFGPN